MSRKINTLTVFASLTVVLFTLMLIGYKLFSSSLSTIESWRLGLWLTGLLLFTSLFVAVLVVYIQQRKKKTTDVIIKGKQMWLWFGYVVIVSLQAVIIIGDVVDRYRGAAAITIFMIIVATWGVCGLLNDMEKKEAEKVQKESDVEIEQSE